MTRRHIEYHPTDNLLEATKIIAGSKMFIGNQSVLFWLAAGLGHKLIQETCHTLHTRNSIVPRENAFYSDNFENLKKIYDELELEFVMPANVSYTDEIVPAPRVNRSTSAGDFRKNLSTSAELFQEL
jgi:ADP-heptose:LPS heptosyltransferase